MPGLLLSRQSCSACRGTSPPLFSALWFQCSSESGPASSTSYKVLLVQARSCRRRWWVAGSVRVCTSPGNSCAPLAAPSVPRRPGDGLLGARSAACRLLRALGFPLPGLAQRCLASPPRRWAAAFGALPALIILLLQHQLF